MLRLYLRTIWSAMFFHLKQIAVDGFVLFTVIVQPLLIAMLAIYLFRQSAEFTPITVVIGSSMSGLWSATLFFSSTNINVERRSGTLEFIIASPTHLAMVIFGKTLANTLISVNSIIVSYLFTTLMVGYQIKIVNPLLFFVSFLLAFISFVSLGLLVASFMSVNLGAGVWANALEFPIYILGGFMFPVALLPVWTVPLSKVLAPYWIMQALNTSATKDIVSHAEILRLWENTFLLAIFYCVISMWLFKLLLSRARVTGTLGYQ